MKLSRTLCFSLFSVAALLPRAAYAQYDDDADQDEAPGSASTPPEPAVEVTPPSSTPLPTPVKGTTSDKIYVQGDEVGHPHRHGGDALVYRRGRYMLRDGQGIFELSPAFLMQFDTYGYFGPGVAEYQRPDGSGLKTGLSARRLRLELVGRVLRHWYFVIGAESASGGAMVPLNDYVGVEASPMLRVQVGQMRIPFTMENVTSIRWNDFMERSLMTRNLAAPFTRDLGAMVWGGTERSAIWYALGYFGGDGQNRPSPDNRGDVIGRLVLRPLWAASGAIRELHVGISGRYGRRDHYYVNYDAPTMSTPGGYVFWSPVYGTGAGRTHVVPSNEQSAVAAEVFVPGSVFDLRGEVLGVREGRREMLESSPDHNTERSGTLTAWSYYVQATWWPFGPPRPNGPPGNYNALATPPFPRARSLAIAARWEQIFANYDSTDRSTDDTGALVPGVRRGALDANTTAIRVNAFQLAASYWATRHVRITAEYSLYHFPGTPDVSRATPPIDNQAVAPGARANANDPSARLLHEVSARVQVAL